MRKILFTSGIICFSLVIFGQANIPSLQTPNVTNIKRFIDFPVNKSTGVPTINIPIYSIEDKGFSFPVSINYYAGGIKVEEAASNVGLGWALIAEGIVTRTIKGYPDEIGWYKNYGPVPYRWPTILLDEQFNPIAWLNTMYPYEDTEPDIYSFSVNGYSGKFVFDKFRKIHLLPEQDIRIEEVDTTLSAFKITTPDGTQYFIGGTEEYCDVYDGQSETGHMWPTGLHLSKIITPSLKKIEFEYIQDNSGGFHKVATHGSGGLGNGFMPNMYTPPHNVEIHGYKISKIKSDLCNIEFKYKDSARQDCSGSGSGAGALDTIKIKENLSNTILKQFIFSTSYFTSNATSYFTADNYLKKRLRLDEIKECDSSGNCLPAYKFSYNKYNKTTYDYLPNRISFGQDAWGYYNGADDNENLYPTLRDITNAVAYSGQNRSSNENYAKAFILDEIIFPTGGVTSYLFECIKNGGNGYSTPIIAIGGLRVKQVISTSGTGQLPTIKNYRYENATTVGTASQYVMPIALSDLYFGDTDNYPPCGIQFHLAPNMWAMTDPIVTNFGIASQYIYHGKVIEQMEGVGSVEYYYDIESVIDESTGLYEAYWPIFPTNTLLSAGKLLRELYKDEKGDLKKEIDYSYSKFGGNVVDFAYHIFRPFCYQKGKVYSISSGYSYLADKTEINYQEGLTITTNYEYGIPGPPIVAPPLHHFPLKESTMTSDSSIIIKRYKYPIDYKPEIGTPGGSDTWDVESKGIRQAIRDYRINVPIEQITTRKRNNTESIIGATLNQYKTALNATDSLAVFDKISTLNIAVPLTFDSSFISTITKSGSAFQFNHHTNYSTETQFTKYDSSNNLTEMVGKDGITKSFVWGYKKSYPIAQVINAQSKDFYYTSFEDSSGTNITSGGKTGIKSKINGFQKALSGLTNGNYILSYWSNNGGSWSLQQSPVTVSSGSYTINLSGQVDEVRFSPLKSQVSSGTYKPSTGISSMNDPNNHVSTYEYDNFQRLLRIRDQDSNIIKQYSYQYQSVSNQPSWYETGVTRCKRCNIDTAFFENIEQKQLKDTNTNSPTYNQFVWIDGGPSLTCAGAANVYAFIAGDPRCEKDTFNVNTGYVQREAMYTNPCSEYYHQVIWAYSSGDTITCTLPVIYAKLQIGFINYFESEAVADIELHFFSDSACLQPYQNGSVAIANFTRQNSCTTTSSYTDPYAGGTVYVLLYNATIFYVDEYDQTCNITYTLLPGTGYIVR